MRKYPINGTLSIPINSTVITFPFSYKIMQIIQTTLTILFTILIVPFSNAQVFWDCPKSNGNLTESSPFNTTLTNALSSLTSMASTKPFYNVTVGSIESNQVYALYSCQHDLPPELCRGCVENATKNVFDLCYPSAKEAIIMYKECILCYANRMIFSTMELKSRDTNCNSLSYYTHTNEVNIIVRARFEDIMDRATKSPDYFAVGKAYHSVIRDTFYYLGQCTPDISQENCNECLSHALNQTVQSCASDGRLSGYTIKPSCLMRYDTDQFFYATPPNESRIGSLFTTKKGHGNLVVFGKVCLGIFLAFLAFIFLSIVFTKIRRACYTR